MITSKVLGVGKDLVNLLPTRGEVAAQEQIKAFARVFVTNGETCTPQTRGEVAAQEQMRIVEHVMTHKAIQPREPKTRGEVGSAGTNEDNRLNHNQSASDRNLSR